MRTFKVECVIMADYYLAGGQSGWEWSYQLLDRWFLDKTNFSSIVSVRCVFGRYDRIMEILRNRGPTIKLEVDGIVARPTPDNLANRYVES